MKSADKGTIKLKNKVMMLAAMILPVRLLSHLPAARVR